MDRKLIPLVAILASGLFCGLAESAEHSSQAQGHASEAARSAGDSKAVAEHASEALKHMDAARSQATSPAMVKHINDSEAALKSAVKNAERYNSDAAAQDAQDAKTHLDSATRK